MTHYFMVKRRVGQDSSILYLSILVGSASRLVDTQAYQEGCRDIWGEAVIQTLLNAAVHGPWGLMVVLSHIQNGCCACACHV